MLESSSWSAADLVGGDPCLDLINTAGGRTKARDVERLTDYEVALGWAVVAGLLEESAAGRLREATARTPEEAAVALVRLRRFREDLHALLLAVVQEEPSAADLHERVEATLQEAAARARLQRQGERFTWSIGVEEAGLDSLRLRAGLAASRLLTGDELPYLRNCERCSWLYLDRSRGRRRRWCSMAACGNRAKVQRHYQRRQELT